MKLKLIKDSEVVVDRLEYNNLKSTINLFSQIECSVINKSVSYEVFYYGEMCDVVVMSGKGYMIIKRFDTDDYEYNCICAEELVELLNQKQ